jgi:AmmeMemoRadiSam system protein A
MDAYLELAKFAISNFLTDPNKLFEYPNFVTEEMKTKRSGVFVSLHHKNKLRGSVGTYEPIQQNIAYETVANAISAACRDPRFKPLTKKELEEIEITVDVLSKLEPLDSLTELNPIKYGVFVEKNNKRGLLLPDLKGIDSIKKQVDLVLKKADINDGIYGCKFYRFTTDRHW